MNSIENFARFISYCTKLVSLQTPIRFMEKKGRGKLRMCIDYKILNSNTLYDA